MYLLDCLPNALHFLAHAPVPMSKIAQSLIPLLSFLILPLACLDAAESARDGGRPNFVIVFCDDLGWSDIGCYGSEIETPNIDSLAQRGMRFTQAYNTCRCCPSRASLLTGLWSHQAGIGMMVYRDSGPGYEGNLSENVVTFADALGQDGYQTMMVGKWHVGHRAERAHPEKHGWQKFTGIYSHIDSYWNLLPGSPIHRDGSLWIPAGKEPENPYRPGEDFYTTEFFTDAALDYIDQATDSKKPFVLHLCYNVPHFPLETPDELIKKYKGKYLDGWDELTKQKIVRQVTMGLHAPRANFKRNQSFANVHISSEIQQRFGMPKNAIPRWDKLGKQAQRELDFRRAMYAGQVDNLDQNVGRLVQRLKQCGVLDNTVILFLSDNGCSGETGDFGMNWGNYFESNYSEWKKKSGWSISQGACWAAYSNAPFRMYKKFVHEGGISTPLIVHWPAGLDKPGRIEKKAVVHLVDVFPTLMELSGAEQPRERNGVEVPKLVGESFADHIQDANTLANSRTLFWQHENHSAIRDGDWKLVTFNDRRKDGWELYQMDGGERPDRGETRNLAMQHPDRVTAMKAKWREWAESVKALPFPEQRSTPAK